MSIFIEHYGSCVVFGANWAQRVFFSDNGSTANEIALKMAFRVRYGQ